VHNRNWILHIFHIVIPSARSSYLVHTRAAHAYVIIVGIGYFTLPYLVHAGAAHVYVIIVGIGYFTLPYLVHAGAAHVYACEWNPDAVEALKTNLTLNNVSNRCTVLFGDNRQATHLP